MHFSSPFTYQRTRLAEHAADHEITQTISLPPAMHQPSLAFYSKMIQTVPDGESYFEVRVSDGITSTQVYTRAQGADWEQGWADLSAWSGQQVEVRFILHQRAGEPPVQLYLDDISLGSWLTPLVESIAPAELEESWISTTVTITGVNFISTPTVLIGDLQATSVEFVDVHTLRATLPSTAYAGLLRCVGGQSGAAARRVSERVAIGQDIISPAGLAVVRTSD